MRTEKEMMELIQRTAEEDSRIRAVYMNGSRTNPNAFSSFCGEDYLALLRKEKKNAHWAFIFVSHKEYSYYLNNFGKQFQRGT